MNRPIKFRAWDGKEMRYSEELNRDMDGAYRWFAILEDQDVTLEGMLLMQFTGLLDKNGKEIWEGDILKVPTNKRLRVIEDMMIDISWRDAEISEVIGNIYENSELLKA